MKIRKLYKGLRYLVIGVICLLIAAFLFTLLMEIRGERELDESFESLPNYDYIPEIKDLKEEGKLSEALEMARFVARHPDMPGWEDAKGLERELEQELNSLWGRTKRTTKGFILGSGNSIEELSGSVISDLIIYGDIRDLVKQGYYRITGKETDPLIAALAGIGLLTEVIDAIDWSPAVLKAFRKIGALSRKFADFLIAAAKKSVKAGRLDGALKVVFSNIRHLSDQMGLVRTAAVFKHIDTPSDLTSLVKVSRKNADAVYFTVRNGGSDGIAMIKRFGDTDAGVASLAKAAKKGPAGIQWLKRSGKTNKYLVRTRFGARILKTFRLHRPQRFIMALAKEFPLVLKALWACTVLACVVGGIVILASGREFYHLRRDNQKRSGVEI